MVGVEDVSVEGKTSVIGSEVELLDGNESAVGMKG